MPRYRIVLEYDGTPFFGWQRQPDLDTVQGVVEDALISFQKDPVAIFGAGRTDAGVHAIGQVAHFDLVREHDPFRVQEALNHFLKPHPVGVLACDRVADGFDARFGALLRHYRYRILARRAPPTLSRDHVWWLPMALNVERMAEAAQVFIGHHDFTTFRATQCQALSPMKTMERFTVVRDGDEIHLDVTSRSFLHNQVRSMVGSLKFVGEGKWSADDVRRALAAKRRTACGVVAPPQGLCLMRVEYPETAQTRVFASSLSNDQAFR